MASNGRIHESLLRTVVGHVVRSWLQNVAVVLIGAGFVVGCASKPDLKRWASDVLRAERKLQHGKYEEALADFTALEKAAHFYTDAVEMRLRQAEVYRRSQQYEDALGIMATLPASAHG